MLGGEHVAPSSLGRTRHPAHVFLKRHGSLPFSISSAPFPMRFVWRQLTRNPGFSLVAILMLAIGIGANTALFTFANAVLARSAPGVHTDDRIVWLTPRSTH